MQRKDAELVRGSYSHKIDIWKWRRREVRKVLTGISFSHLQPWLALGVHPAAKVLVMPIVLLCGNLFKNTQTVNKTWYAAKMCGIRPRKWHKEYL